MRVAHPQSLPSMPLEKSLNCVLKYTADSCCQPHSVSTGHLSAASSCSCIGEQSMGRLTNAASVATCAHSCSIARPMFQNSACSLHSSSSSLYHQPVMRSHSMHQHITQLPCPHAIATSASGSTLHTPTNTPCATHCCSMGSSDSAITCDSHMPFSVSRQESISSLASRQPSTNSIETCGQCSRACSVLPNRASLERSLQEAKARVAALKQELEQTRPNALPNSLNRSRPSSIDCVCSSDRLDRGSNNLLTLTTGVASPDRSSRNEQIRMLTNYMQQATESIYIRQRNSGSRSALQDSCSSLASEAESIRNSNSSVHRDGARLSSAVSSNSMPNSNGGCNENIYSNQAMISEFSQSQASLASSCQSLVDGTRSHGTIINHSHMPVVRPKSSDSSHNVRNLNNVRTPSNPMLTFDGEATSNGSLINNRCSTGNMLNARSANGSGSSCSSNQSSYASGGAGSSAGNGYSLAFDHAQLHQSLYEAKERVAALKKDLLEPNSRTTSSKVLSYGLPATESIEMLLQRSDCTDSDRCAETYPLYSKNTLYQKDPLYQNVQYLQPVANNVIYSNLSGICAERSPATPISGATSKAGSQRSLLELEANYDLLSIIEKYYRKNDSSTAVEV